MADLVMQIFIKDGRAVLFVLSDASVSEGWKNHEVETEFG